MMYDDNSTVNYMFNHLYDSKNLSAERLTTWLRSSWYVPVQVVRKNLDTYA